jgi:hypothetical protein
MFTVIYFSLIIIAVVATLNLVRGVIADVLYLRMAKKIKDEFEIEVK